MAKTNTSIEINGKRYDAKTGASLDHVTHQPASHAHAKTTRRATVKPLQPHVPEHAQTLMRSSVKKPSAMTADITARGHLTKRPLAEVVVNRSAKNLDTRRVGHAKRIPQSRLIKHFSDLGSARPEAALPTATAPVPQDLPVAPPSARPHTTSDLFEHALKSATSHKQPAHKKRRGHKPAIAAAVIAVIAIVGLTGSQVLLDARLHVASSKAGFDASLPGYKPAGYSLSQINYNSTTVATAFHSNSNDTNYSLTRQRSNWDSQTLRDQYVAPADPNFKTATSAGQTIYLYGTSNASWVSGGIWYIVQSNGALNQRQLLDLASSL